MPEPEVFDLAGAVADGEQIDWPAAQARLATPDAHRLASGLLTISRVSAASGQAARAESHGRRLSWLFETVRLVSVVCTAFGSVGLIALVREAGLGRYAVMLLVLATFGATAVYLDAGGRDRRARALAFCLWTSAAAFSARGVFWMQQTWPDVAWLQVLFALRPEAFFAAGVWQFAREFPAVTRFGPIDRVCGVAVRVATALGGVLFAVNLVPLFAPGSALEGWVEPLQRMSGKGPIFWDLVFGTAAAALAAIAWRCRTAAGTERARVRLFLYAVAASLGPMMADVVAQGLSPAFYDYRSAPGGFFWGAVMVYPPMFLLPIATAYAIAASDVLGVGVVIQRSLRYLLTRWLVMWGAAIPVALLIAHLVWHADQPMAEAVRTTPAPLMLWLSLGGVVLMACRRMLVRALDRWALPGAEDTSTMLAQMSERMKHARTRYEVTTTFARAAERALQAPATAYLVIERLLSPAGAGGALPPRDSLIGVLLEGSREPCVVSPRLRHSYYALMTQADRQWIDAESVDVVVPVMSGRKGSGVLAVIALARRRNALSFSQDDLRFLRAGAAAASLACDAIHVTAAEDGTGESAAPDDVAVECTTCGRVERWTVDALACSCGGAFAAAFLPKAPVAGFELDRRLGAGGMGIVYLATDMVLQRKVAIKTLPRLSDEAAERLISEARTMAGLSHPQVAVLYGAERWRGTPLLTMEYLSGGTLADRLRRGALPAEEACWIVARLALALDYVHGTGRYHGDIKPSNIGFSSNGEPKFLDFGLSRAVAGPVPANDSSRVQGRPDHVGGTPAYLSPEVREGSAPGPALDLWALALVLCECLLGVHPFPAARTRADVTSASAEARRRIQLEASPRLGDVVAAALSVEAARRPAGAIELANAIKSALSANP